MDRFVIVCIKSQLRKGAWLPRSFTLPSDAKIEIGKAAEEIRFKGDLKARLLPEIAKWIAKKTSRA